MITTLDTEELYNITVGAIEFHPIPLTQSSFPYYFPAFFSMNGVSQLWLINGMY